VSLCSFSAPGSFQSTQQLGKRSASCCAAPEIISNLHIKDATKIDIWSAGVMLYVMLFCCYPFERPDDSKDQGDQQKYQRVGMSRNNIVALARQPCAAVHTVRKHAPPL